MSSLVLAVANILIYLRHPYFCMRFRKRVGLFPNPANPRSYTDYVFWRKMFDRNPAFVVFCDKLACKQYIKSKVPALPVPETVWTGKTFDRSAFELFTDETVLKANHGCNMNLVPDGRARSFDELKRLTEKWLRKDYSRKNLEHAYGGVEKRLFLETRLYKPGGGLVEIQVRAANGRAFLLSACTDQKTANEKIGYYDVEGKRVRAPDMNNAGRCLPDDFRMPAAYRDAIRFVEILGKDVDYARYDFYCLDGKLYGGEITLYPSAGLGRADKRSRVGLDAIIADNWDIRTSHFFKSRGSPPIEFYKRHLLKALNRRGAAAV